MYPENGLQQGTMGSDVIFESARLYLVDQGTVGEHVRLSGQEMGCVFSCFISLGEVVLEARQGSLTIHGAHSVDLQ